MKKKIDLLPIFFVVILALVMAAALCIRTFLPGAVLPKLDIPAMVGLSLIALLTEQFTGKVAKRDPVCLAIYGALAFSLLPAAAGIIPTAMWWKYALVGGIVFSVTVALYTSLTRRLLSGPTAKAAPVIGAVCLWLASQCFSGIIL